MMICGAEKFILEPTTWTFLLGMVVAFAMSAIVVRLGNRRQK